MKLLDYELLSPKVVEIVDNEGKKTFCVQGLIQCQDEDFAIKRPPMETFFVDDVVRKAGGEFVAYMRSLLPSTGGWKDANGVEHKWNGLKTLKEGDVFTMDNYHAICAKLFAEKYTSLSNGAFVTVPTPYPCVQLYSQNLGRVKEGDVYTNEPLYKKGDPVCYKDLLDGKRRVVVYRELKVFIRCVEAGVTYKDSQPIDGWDWQSRLKSKLRMYKRLDSFKEELDKNSDMKAKFYVDPTDVSGETKPEGPEAPVIIDDTVAEV